MIPSNDTHVLCNYNPSTKSYDVAYKFIDLCKTTDLIVVPDVTKEIPCRLKNGQLLNL